MHSFLVLLGEETSALLEQYYTNEAQELTLTEYNPFIWHGRCMAGIPGIRIADCHRDGNCNCAES